MALATQLQATGIITGNGPAISVQRSRVAKSSGQKRAIKYSVASSRKLSADFPGRSAGRFFATRGPITLIKCEPTPVRPPNEAGNYATAPSSRSLGKNRDAGVVAHYSRNNREQGTRSSA